ncbi:CoA pyrophosphatase [bacterium]|nr:CoA pyrophosphatase [bacterium]
MTSPIIPKASIAVIRLQIQGEPHILMMQRSFDDRDPWSGHWSFPGGKIEPDETPLEASIRESYEEVGASLSADQLSFEMEIGKAGSAVGREIWVKPFVFDIQELPKLKLQTDEVHQTIWLKEKDFLNPRLHGEFSVFKDKPELTFKGFNIPKGKGVLWGFSYRILKDLYSS